MQSTRTFDSTNVQPIHTHKQAKQEQPTPVQTGPAQLSRDAAVVAAPSNRQRVRVVVMPPPESITGPWLKQKATYTPIQQGVLDNSGVAQRKVMSQAWLLTTRALMAIAFTSAMIFWGSALVGVWAAYDQAAALGRFGLISVGLLLIALVYQSTRRASEDRTGEDRASGIKAFGAVGMDSGLLAGGFGLLFLLSHNWQHAAEQDFTLFPWLTTWIQTQQPLWGEGILLHENLVAGGLIILLPIAIVTLWQQWHEPQPSRIWSSLGVLIGLIALLLTFSRGAWLGLIGGTAVASYLYWRMDEAVQQHRHWERQRARQQSNSHRQLRHRQLRYRLWATWWQRLRLAMTESVDHLFNDYATLDWVMGGSILIGIGYLVGMTVSPVLHDLLLQPVAGTYLAVTINSRLAVWQDVLPLIQDYPFTGSGLGSTPMVMASYVYLLHVPYLNHAHSLYLQVAVEQGLPGLIGLLGMIISAGGLGVMWLRTGSSPERRLATGALTALVALLIYGAVDAELYVGLLVPLLFLPFALLIGCTPGLLQGLLYQTQSGQATIVQPEEAGSAEVGTADKLAITTVGNPGRWIMTIVGAALPLLILFGLFLLPGTQTRWLLNQATVMQSRQELALYEWPTWPLQDALRRSDQIDTAQWMAMYETVLAKMPDSVSANRRLGQILLSQGNYQAAEQRLTRAYTLAPQQRATRQLLGEVKALLGDQTAALALWRTVDLSQGQLELRLWWHEHLGERTEALDLAQVIDEVTQ